MKKMVYLGQKSNEINGLLGTKKEMKKMVYLGQKRNEKMVYLGQKRLHSSPSPYSSTSTIEGAGSVRIRIILTDKRIRIFLPDKRIRIILPDKRN